MKNIDPSIKFVYFDIGKVLLHPHGLAGVAKALNIHLETLKASWAKYELQASIGTISLQAACELSAIESGYTGQHHDYPSIWSSSHIAIPETHAFAKELAQIVPVGLLTNVYSELVRSGISHGVIPNLTYSAIVESCVVGENKPHPKIYEIAEKAAGIPPENLFLIDDQEENVTAAKARGWGAVLFQPDNPAESVAEIRKLINSV